MTHTVTKLVHFDLNGFKLYRFSDHELQSIRGKFGEYKEIESRAEVSFLEGGELGRGVKGAKPPENFTI